MADKLTQRLIPFDEVIVETASPRRQPATEEAAAAFGRLEGWLLDVSGRPVTELAGQIHHAVRLALLEGKNGWFHAAEDLLTAAQACPDAAGVAPGDEREILKATDDLLDCLHERFAKKRGVRPA